MAKWISLLRREMCCYCLFLLTNKSLNEAFIESKAICASAETENREEKGSSIGGTFWCEPPTKNNFEEKKNEKIKEHQTAQNELCRKNLDNNKTIKQREQKYFLLIFYNISSFFFASSESRIVECRRWESCWLCLTFFDNEMNKRWCKKHKKKVFIALWEVAKQQSRMDFFYWIFYGRGNEAATTWFFCFFSLLLGPFFSPSNSTPLLSLIYFHLFALLLCACRILFHIFSLNIQQSGSSSLFSLFVYKLTKNSLEILCLKRC